MKNTFAFRSLSLAVAAAATTVPTTFLAHADLAYTQEMRMASMKQPNNAPMSTTRYFKRPGAERMESSSKMGNYESRSVIITQCAKKEQYTLDPALKLYYVTPLVKSTTYNVTNGKAPAIKAGPTTGTMTSTLVSFKSLGVQKVGNISAPAYEAVIRMQTSGCLGNSDNTTKQQFFVAPGQTLDAGGADCGLTSAGSSSGGRSTCNPVMVRKGNWASYDKVMRSLQVRNRMFSKPTDANWTIETQTVGISRAPLAGSLFQVPAGFKKVSETEFQQAQSQAMMKKMMGGQSFDNGPSDENG